MLSNTVREASSAASWNTNPNRRARNSERRRSGQPPTSSPSKNTRPVWGVSINPNTYSNVDLPRPDTPVTAVTAP